MKFNALRLYREGETRVSRMVAQTLDDLDAGDVVIRAQYAAVNYKDARAVSGAGNVVGEALVSHPDVDMVSFTGSTRAGKRISEVAAATVKRVALELGGKSASLILEDADLVDLQVSPGKPRDALRHVDVWAGRRRQLPDLNLQLVGGKSTGTHLVDGLDGRQRHPRRLAVDGHWFMPPL